MIYDVISAWFSELQSMWAPEVEIKNWVFDKPANLSMLSKNVNVGIESVSYINEFQNSKELIFKTK
jgi:hypothetical protein